MERDILHINIYHFMASVAQVRDPALCGRPRVVAPAGLVRARVHDLSREAFTEGIRRGMFLDDALKRCRGAAVVDPDPSLCGRAMKAVMDELNAFSPLCERAGAGHAFLDLSGTQRLFGPAVDAADRIRRALRDRLSLDAGVGVAAGVGGADGGGGAGGFSGLVDSVDSAAGVHRGRGDGK